MLDLGKVAATAGQRLAALSDLSEDVTALSERVVALDRTIKQSFVTKDQLDKGYPTFDVLDRRIKVAEASAKTAHTSLQRRSVVGAGVVVLVVLGLVAAGWYLGSRASVQADYKTCLRSNESRGAIRDTFVNQSEALIAAFSPQDGSEPSPRVQEVIDRYRRDTLVAVRSFAPRDCVALYPSANHKESP